jgi:hypothetical protein
MKILITEKQLKHVIGEQVSQVQVQYDDGSIKTVDYQKFYYSNEFKQYKWDGKKFVFDYSKIYKNWNTMTPADREKVIANRRKVKSVGSYSQQPNLISLGVNEFNSFLKNVVWSNLTFDNIVEIITKLMEFIPPPYGGKANKKGVEVAHAISYYIRFIFSKNVSEMTSNFVNGMFKLFSSVSDSSVPMIPSKVRGVVGKIIGIFMKIKDKILKITGFNSLSQWLQISLTMIVELVGEGITNLIQNITEYLLKPIVKVVAPINISLSNIIGNLIGSLNEISVNLKSAKLAADYLKQQDPNAFT